jgi:hypothetical protein
LRKFDLRKKLNVHLYTDGGSRLLIEGNVVAVLSANAEKNSAVVDNN